MVWPLVLQPLQFKKVPLILEWSCRSDLPPFNGGMMEFEWEQRGGRLKLVEKDAVVSVVYVEAW